MFLYAFYAFAFHFNKNKIQNNKLKKLQKCYKKVTFAL